MDLENVGLAHNWARNATNTSSGTELFVSKFSNFEIKSVSSSDLICLWRNGRDKWVTLEELEEFNLNSHRIAGVLVWRKLIHLGELHQQITVYSK